MNSSPRPVPLNFFGIPFGLLGLADCWLVAATFGLAPVALGRLLVAIAVIRSQYSTQSSRCLMASLGLSRAKNAPPT